jgi:hypothetical protein
LGRHELEQIMCKHFAEDLIARGFGDKGAFAYITEEELMGPPLWINRKATRRILGEPAWLEYCRSLLVHTK